MANRKGADHNNLIYQINCGKALKIRKDIFLRLVGGEKNLMLVDWA